MTRSHNTGLTARRTESTMYSVTDTLCAMTTIGYCGLVAAFALCALVGAVAFLGARSAENLTETLCHANRVAQIEDESEAAIEYEAISAARAAGKVPTGEVLVLCAPALPTTFSSMGAAQASVSGHIMTSVAPVAPASPASSVDSTLPCKCGTTTGTSRAAARALVEALPAIERRLEVLAYRLDGNVQRCNENTWAVVDRFSDRTLAQVEAAVVRARDARGRFRTGWTVQTTVLPC